MSFKNRFRHSASESRATTGSARVAVGIDLFGLIRLKPKYLLTFSIRTFQSRDWSVWIDTIETLENLFPTMLLSISRDWSVWIDTIETSVWPLMKFPQNTGRDWSVWIDTIETTVYQKPICLMNLSGLICLDWYDWNINYIDVFTINCY